MKKYIDAEKLKEAFSTDTQHLSTFDPDLYDLIMLDIDEAPTADVVEVVRCKDCTRRVDYEGMIMCNKFGHKFQGEWFGLWATTEDHFCSYGERRTDNDTL